MVTNTLNSLNTLTWPGAFALVGLGAIFYLILKLLVR